MKSPTRPHGTTSEELREEALAQGGCGLFWVDGRGILIAADTGARRLLAVGDGESARGLCLDELLGSGNTIARLLEEAQRDATGARGSLTFRPPGADASRCLALHAVASDSEFCLFVRDATSEMVKTARIEHAGSMLRAVRQINKLVVSASDERALAQGACEALVQTRGYRNAWIALLGDNSGLTHFAQAGAAGEPAVPVRNAQAIGDVPCFHLALESGEPVVVADDTGLCRGCVFGEDDWPGSALVARLQQGQRIHGVLHVAMPPSLANDAEEQALFEETAGEIALAVDSLRLAAERRRQEETVRRSNLRLTSTLESLTEGFLALDPRGVVTYLNAAGESLLMRRREEIEGRRFFRAFPELRGSDVEERYREAKQSGQPVAFEALIDFAPYPNWYSVRIYPGELGYSVFFSMTSDIQRMEVDLLRSQELFHTFMDQLPVTAFIKDGRDLKLRYVNAFMAERFGSADWIGKSAHEYYEEEVARRAIEHDRYALEGGPTVYDEWAPDKSGRWRFLRTHKFPVQLSGGERLLGGLAVDLTEVRQTQEALAASEYRFRSLFTSMSDGVVLHEIVPSEDGPPDLRFVDFNPAFQAMLGGANRIPLGVLATELRRRGIEYPAERVIAAASAGDERFETDLGLEGRMFRILAFVPGPDRVACIITDISEAVRLQAERERFEARARHAQKLESLGVLAGGIAHDFNNLLMGILGNVELASLDAQSDHQRAHLKDIERASHRAADLCQQMLAYSGRGKFVVQRIDLTSLASETRRLLAATISDRALVNEELTPDVPPIRADATQIRQVVMNLITNASDALEDGEGVIAIRTGARPMTSAELAQTYLHDDLPDGLYAYVEVEDTGCGLPAEMMPRVFEPFFSTKFMGRGLGMSAVIGIVRSHGGAIDLESAPGEGTRIRVLFPVEDEEEAARSGSQAAAESGNLEGRLRILVVDDDPMVLKLARRMLRNADMEAVIAKEGPEALDALEKSETPIDAVILDRAMPGMSGEEVFRRIREVRPHMPVILSSGFAEEETLKHFNADEHTGFLQKPYQTRQLMDALRKAVGR